jgi:hypothetical protein
MRMNKWIGVLVIGFLGISFSAAAETGTTALGILTRSYGARAQGLGQALVADSGHLDAIAFNPAGMAKMKEHQTSATFQRGLAEDKIGYLNLGYNLPFGAVYAAASYLDAGNIDLNLTDGTQETRRAQEDVVGLIGFALGKNTPVSIGASVKMFRSELAEVASANGVAGDAGISWETPLSFLTLAGSVQNVGSDVSYESTDDELPTTTRYGAQLLFDNQDKLLWPDVLRNRYALTVDGVKMNNENVTANVGLEIRKDFGPDYFPMHTALRGGYNGATRAPAVGAGFQADAIIIDYAVNFIESFDVAHRITITLRFGYEKIKKEFNPYTW